MVTKSKKCQYRNSCRPVYPVGMWTTRNGSYLHRQHCYPTQLSESSTALKKFQLPFSLSLSVEAESMKAINNRQSAEWYVLISNSILLVLLYATYFCLFVRNFHSETSNLNWTIRRVRYTRYTLTYVQTMWVQLRAFYFTVELVWIVHLTEHLIMKFCANANRACPKINSAGIIILFFIFALPFLFDTPRTSIFFFISWL